MFRMKAFYQAYEKVPQAVAQYPSCYVEHQFCRECYQKEVKKLVKKYRSPSLAGKVKEKEEELLYV